MEYISLENLRNKYPEESLISQKYTRSGNTIVYSGKNQYKNKINLDFDISNIQTVPNATFNFIVDINGSLYTSSNFLSLLQKASSDNNPYFQKRTVPIVKVNLNEALSELSDNSIGEQYAEVSVTSNLDIGNTTEKVLKHIDWLVTDQTEGLRDIKTGNNRVYGDYQLNTSQYIIESDSGLGFEFTDALEGGLGTSRETNTTNVPPTSDMEYSIPKFEIKQPKPITVTPTGIKINTPTGTFTGVNQNFLLGGTDRNNGLADVGSTIRQLSDFDGLDRTGLRSQYDTGDFGPLGAMFEE